MKLHFFIIAALMTFSSAFASADTESQKRARQMVNILSTPEIQKYLEVEDGVGNLKSLQYVDSGRASFGPNNFRVEFLGRTLTGRQLCVLAVSVDSQTDKVLSASMPKCLVEE
ncbi:MAG: hypothetical protein IT289_10535 [Oligoflexia bacterium]|nr:hypothetical protein [Oligoflexia bacterium]